MQWPWGDPGARDPALSDSLVGLLADAEAEDGGVARPRTADWFQACPRKARGREADAVAEQNREYIHQDLVDEPPLQALAGHVSAEDFEVLAAGSVPCRGDRFADVAGEDRDVRVRRLQRPMGEEEHGSGERVVDAVRLLGLHPVAYLPSPPADEHGAGGRCDLRDIVRCHEVGESAIIPPVHGMAGTGDEAVKRHTPVHDNLAAHVTTTIPGPSPHVRPFPSGRLRVHTRNIELIHRQPDPETVPFERMSEATTRVRQFCAPRKKCRLAHRVINFDAVASPEKGSSRWR